MVRVTWTQGDWCYSNEHQELCQILEVRSLWGSETCQIWLPNLQAVAPISAAQLRPITADDGGSLAKIVYLAAAAKVADALTKDVLLAPMESSLIPLPHQLSALARVMGGQQIRYLLADEVGLGKTIEAGLIMRELKLRGLVKRTLVVAPKGLATQWVSEMRFHFGEAFQLVLPEELKGLQKIMPRVDLASSDKSDHIGPAAVSNSWRMFNQAVVPMDSVKPMEKHRGWSSSQIAQYNRDRFEDLISAGWDLVIIDEAHRLGGSSDQVARFKLGQGLACASPYLLLLSATPHQGKTDAFHRLVSLLDAKAFPEVTDVTKDKVKPYVIRTEKRRAIDSDGKALFKPRRTELVAVAWGKNHDKQRMLYEAVTEYVRQGYNQAIQEKRSYIGFLMILMQRLVVSSTSAIRTTLAKRLDVLSSPEEQLSLFPNLTDEDIADMDGQEQMETLLGANFKALKNERSEVRVLLEAATHCEQLATDVKAEALLEKVYSLQAEEGDSNLKVLIFTEFVPTQEMLEQFLSQRGFSVVCLNGSMSMEERRAAQEAFARDTRILVSTDAGGEGLNLQFCHVVINYDIPWNPMRLEQRIGRVDRIGQAHTVRAVNFIIEDSVEHRVREVLEHKLEIIFKEFGIDKTGDVLDSAQASRIFDEVYMEAILKPDSVEGTVTEAINRLQVEARGAQETSVLLGTTGELNSTDAQKLLTHPLPHWVESMTVNFLNSHGGQATRKKKTWQLQWPDGHSMSEVVFSGKEAESVPSAKHLTLEDSRVHELMTKLPRHVRGQPVPTVSIEGIANDINGVWSLWSIGIRNIGSATRRILPLFASADGKVYNSTARHIWDQLVGDSALLQSYASSEMSCEAFDRSEKHALEDGQQIFQSLVQDHLAQIEQEREKNGLAFAARRRAIERIGLPQVQAHRLAQVVAEEKVAREDLAQRSQTLPEIFPLLLLQVGGAANG